ncbi:low molecular weight phosphatase family protein [Mycetocola sp. JXN-3]|uniref:arsenate reductase/protein-tyrosine-phosphatase family protein n=1 Tax=Mycetocola sp. JXN-3 TaxID=2116510 RepID=UPI00165D0784|nr:low molecular weight phosphatase family protein [Mycetocola sp. JXN-3]
MSPLSILVVCTGNICRSPYAERALQALADRIAPGTFSVTSAGTRAVVGRGMESGSARILTEHGIPTDGPVARQLTADMVTGADLVLGLAREHRAEVLDLVPGALRRTFTLREFARLLASCMAAPSSADVQAAASADTIPDRWRALTPLALRHRTDAKAADPADDDVLDPYGLDDTAFRIMAAQIDAALVPLLDTLTRLGAADPHPSTSN